MTCHRQTFWLGPDNAGLYTCLHLPNSATIRSVGVVLCHALGHEYTHSHRSMRYLADKLAHNGYACTRFDYLGTGDSASDLCVPRNITDWLDNIEQQVQFLKRNTDVESVCLLGIRMGASLAALFAESRTVDYLALWNPCISGQRYIREMQALNIMANNQLTVKKTNQFNGIESAGFAMHADTVEQIQQLNLKKLNLQKNYQACKKILLIERDDTVVNNKYYDVLKKNKLLIEQIRTPGFADMLAEPQDTIIPKKAIQQITHWLDDCSRQHQAINIPLRQTDTDHKKTQVFNWGNARIKETICTLGKQNLIGVLSQPNSNEMDKENQPLPLIVISNSGSAHHVGPNRLYIELTRSLAAVGFSCLRFDLSNLGDSIDCSNIDEDSAEENHPYPSTATNDVKTVITQMQDRFGFKQFVLAGLCSGAHTSFHAGLSDLGADIRECILINPLTFYWQEGMSLDIPHAFQTIKEAKYYQYAAKDIKKWLKFFRGQTQTRDILLFTANYCLDKISRTFCKILEFLKLRKTSDLARDILRYKNHNIHLSFFFSTTDPGYNILLSEAKRAVLTCSRHGSIDIDFIENADHTFSIKTTRQDLIKKLKCHLLARYTETSTHRKNTDYR